MKLLLLFFTVPLSAATVFIKNGRIDGELRRQSDKEIVIKPKEGMEVTVPRDQILTLHDDAGNLLWSHPSIVKSDPTPDAPAKLEIPSPELAGTFRGMHFGITGGFGMVWPSSLLSSYPLGTTQDYRIAYDITASGFWYYLNDQALTFGIGYARRNISISGINEIGLIGDGYWPMDYADLRIGHRWHTGVLFFESGLLAAVNISKAPLHFQTASGTLLNGTYGTPTYLALSIAIGANIPITRQLFGLFTIQAEHALTAAVTGNAPTSTTVVGQIQSTAPLSLFPLGVTVHAGASWRFDLPARR